MSNLSTNIGETTIHFEPGSHSKNSEETDTLVSRTERGDPNATEWGQAITTRLARYSPSLLAVDSMIPIGLIEREDGSIDLADDIKKLFWVLTPDRPSVVNGGDHFYVIAGDCIYAHKDLSQNALMASMAVGAFAGSLVGSVFDDAVYDMRRFNAGYDNVTGEFDRKKASEISRRSFFSLLGTCVGMFALSGEVFNNFLNSGTQDLVDGASRAVNRLEPVMPHRNIDQEAWDIVDGRTALLIAKILNVLEVVEDLEVDDASIVMGNAHTFHAPELLRSSDMRFEFIAKHTEIMKKRALEGETFYSDEDETTTEMDRIVGLKDQQARTYLIRVDEPNDEAFARNPQDEINRCVNFAAEVDFPELRATIDSV